MSNLLRLDDKELSTADEGKQFLRDIPVKGDEEEDDEEDEDYSDEDGFEAE